MDDRVRIFVSYKHDDEDYSGDETIFKELLRFMKASIERVGGEFWTDRQIAPGDTWDDEIRKALAASDIAILMVSQGYLSSPYINDVEIATMLERRAKDGLILLPVLVSPSTWEEHEWLAQTQFMPGRGKTIEGDFKEPGERKKVYADITRAVKERVLAVKAKKAQTGGKAQAAAATTPPQETAPATKPKSHSKKKSAKSAPAAPPAPATSVATDEPLITNQINILSTSGLARARLLNAIAGMNLIPEESALLENCTLQLRGASAPRLSLRFTDGTEEASSGDAATLRAAFENAEELQAAEIAYPAPLLQAYHFIAYPVGLDTSFVTQVAVSTVPTLVLITSPADISKSALRALQPVMDSICILIADTQQGRSRHQRAQMRDTLLAEAKAVTRAAFPYIYAVSLTEDDNAAALQAVSGFLKAKD